VERERFNLLTALLKSRRVVEWSIVAAVLIGLVWALEHQVRVVRGQGERVAVRSTISSLRAALVIEQLMGQVRAQSVPPAATAMPKNPFTLLQVVPPNYAGELAQRDIFSVPPGSWVYDPECGCVGYRLLYTEWLEPEQTAGAIWLRVGGTGGEPRLSPMADYRWMEQRLN
jgi:hypothetical protein